MSAANVEIFCSGTFDFGIQGTHFTVHKKLVQKYSKPLTAMMNNEMKEAQQGLAVLQDTDQHTFARFVEFIYTGDYNPEWPLLPDQSLQSTMELPGKDDGSDCGRLAIAGTKKKPTIQTAVKRPKLSNLTFDTAIRLPLPTTSAVKTGSLKLQDASPVLWNHAHVYVFADMYGIHDLQILATRRLNDVLSHLLFPLDPAVNIVDLICYVYEHTSNGPETVDALRNVISHFAANNIEKLRTSSDFCEMVKQGGEFVESVINKISDRFEVLHE